MITKELIDTINRLARKQKSVGLTEEEKLEQKLARQEYLKSIREQFKSILDSIEFVDKDHQTEGPCTCNHCKGNHVH